VTYGSPAVDVVTPTRLGDRSNLYLRHQQDLVLCRLGLAPTGQSPDATTLMNALGTWFGQPA